MSKVSITIDGHVQTIDTDAILTIRNPDAERPRCAAEMAYWGGIYGAKLEEQENAEAACDHWVAQMTVGVLEKEAAPEWKVKAVVRADPGFMVRHRALARAKRDVASAKAIFDAYSRRADILARLIAKETSERVWSGHAGRESIASSARPSEMTEGEYLERDRLELEAERASEPAPTAALAATVDKRMRAFVAKRTASGSKPK